MAYPRAVQAEPSPADDPVAVPERPVSLHEHLRRLTPRAWVSTTLLAANVAVFALMALAGVDVMQPEAQDLLRWGANSGALVGSGEPWRLLTAAFVHVGLLHLAMNMYVLWQIGPFVERLVGNAGFLALYVVSGLAGSLASAAWHPLVTSAGASGALFGVIGALLGVLARRPMGMPPQAVALMRRNLIVLIGANVLLGLSIPQIDNAGHFGGLAAGFACGLYLGRRELLVTREGRARRGAVVAGIGLAAIAAGVVALPGALGPTFELQREFELVDRRTVQLYASLVERWRERELTDRELAEDLERDVLEAWTDLRRRLEELPPEQAAKVERHLAAARFRERAWKLQIRALRTDDQRVWDEAEELHRQAVEAFRE
jgi:rhomboid protease GluP